MDLTGIRERLRVHADRNAVTTFENGRRVCRTFSTVHEDIVAARDRLASWGVSEGMPVGIRSPNCYQWLVYDIALIELRAPVVAFTDDFAQVSPAELCEKYDLSLFLSGDCGTDMSDYIAHIRGESGTVRVRATTLPREESHFLRPGIAFSSGSSGGIKGLILNRPGVEACVDAFTQAVKPQPNDRLLLFLPISNYQQRLMYYSAFWYGFDLIVVEPVHLFKALQELAPTILIAPPALYEAIESRIQALPAGRRMLAHAMGRLAGMLPVALGRRLSRAVFRQAHEMLGGHIRLMITGMAPIRPATLKWFEIMKLPLFETYGLIESGSVSLNLPGAAKRGSVGRLLPGVSVRFAADGEIFVQREYPIAAGYSQCAEGESEAVFIDGEIATGDIGWMDNDGYLYLTGRKKEIIVTSGGEKIHPEVIEAELSLCQDIACAVVLPRDDGSLAAVILPRNSGESAIEARIRRFVDSLNGRRRNAIIDTVVMTDLVFSRENGLLRPNLKLDRRQIAAHFRSQIHETLATGRTGVPHA